MAWRMLSVCSLTCRAASRTVAAEPLVVRAASATSSTFCETSWFPAEASRTLRGILRVAAVCSSPRAFVVAGGGFLDVAGELARGGVLLLDRGGNAAGELRHLADLVAHRADRFRGRMGRGLDRG